MSEKRFIVEESGNQLIIYDNDGIDDYYHLGNDERDVKAICDLLNEQQATIQFLQDEIDELKKDIRIYKYEEKKHSESARKLYEENEQLKKQYAYVCQKLAEPIDLANLKYKDLVGRPVMRFTKEQKKELINKFKKLEKGDG